MKNLFLFLTLFSLFFCSCQQSLNPEILKGHWQGVEDSNDQLKIDESTFVMGYEGKLMSSEAYEFHAVCAKEYNFPGKPCLMVKRGDQTECYAILSADEASLELVYTAGTGQPLHYKKTDVFELSEPEPEPSAFLIEPNGFLGLQPGNAIADHADILEKGTLQTGEGEFEVYHIKYSEAETIGYVRPSRNDASKIGDIVITTSNALTANNISVGMSFEDLSKVLTEFEVHGSEMEGRTTAKQGNMVFILDMEHFSYDLAKSAVAADTKVKTIEILE